MQPEPENRLRSRVNHVLSYGLVCTAVLRRFALLSAFLVAACAVPKPPARRAATAVDQSAHSTSPATAIGEPEKSPTVTLDEAVQGKVVLVNPALRFVVLDFPVRKMPAIDQRLNVYRNGQKIGEVMVTGPMRDTSAAGDIMAGEAQEGDEVRED